MLMSRQESKFETALRITKAIKDLEGYIIAEAPNGDIYLDSFPVMNMVYLELVREVGDDDDDRND